MVEYTNAVKKRVEAILDEMDELLNKYPMIKSVKAMADIEDMTEPDKIEYARLVNEIGNIDKEVEERVKLLYTQNLN